jgi:hypothetical protein
VLLDYRMSSICLDVFKKKKTSHSCVIPESYESLSHTAYSIALTVHTTVECQSHMPRLAVPLLQSRKGAYTLETFVLTCLSRHVLT